MLTTLSCLDAVLDMQPNVCRVTIIMRGYPWISAYSLPEIRPAGYAAPHSRAPCFLDILYASCGISAIPTGLHASVWFCIDVMRIYFRFRQRHLSIHRNGVEVNMQTWIYKQKISRRNAFSSSVTSAQLPHAVIHLLIYSIAGLPAGWCVKVT